MHVQSIHPILTIYLTRYGCAFLSHPCVNRSSNAKRHGITKRLFINMITGRRRVGSCGCCAFGSAIQDSSSKRVWSYDFRFAASFRAG